MGRPPAEEQVFLAERAGEGWRTVTYRQALDAAQQFGQALLDRGLDAERPIMILSDNGVDHALLALGAMHAGVSVAPVSPAYSLMSRDFGKLRYIADLIRPRPRLGVGSREVRPRAGRNRRDRHTHRDPTRGGAYRARG